MTGMNNPISDGSVKTTDELSTALMQAHDRASQVYANGKKTLVDEMNIDWASWDASDEIALVADQDDLDAEDPLDNDLVHRAA